jgi:DNA polymerase-3 subunit delta'
MRFSEIKGHDDVKTKLINSVSSGHVAHAMMFAGNEGGAGLQLALAFSTYLNCENRGEFDACGNCPSCHKMAKYIHPDVRFFFPVATNEKVKKDPISEKFLVQWREFLLTNPFGTWVDWGKAIGAENKQLLIPKEESRQIVSISSLKSFEGEFKVILIWLPEYMNVYSANALLKILEEPPEKTVFILVSESPDSMLATILSRTQVWKLPPYSINEVAEILKDNYGQDLEKAETIAQISQGNVNEAIKLCSEVDSNRHEEIRLWLLECFYSKVPDLVSRSDAFQKLGREAQKAYLRLSLSVLRESIAAYTGEDSLVNVPESQADFVKKLSKSNGWEKLAAVAEQIDKAYYHLERNLNAKIVFLDTSMLIASIFKAA